MRWLLKEKKERARRTKQGGPKTRVGANTITKVARQVCYVRPLSKKSANTSIDSAQHHLSRISKSYSRISWFQGGAGTDGHQTL